MTRRKTPKPDPRAAIRREEFPLLVDFLRGYLHEDFEADDGAAPAALAAQYRASLGGAEREALSRETRRLGVALAPLRLAALRKVMAKLGAAWQPDSAEEVAGLLAALAGGTEPVPSAGE